MVFAQFNYKKINSAGPIYYFIRNYKLVNDLKMLRKRLSTHNHKIRIRNVRRQSKHEKDIIKPLTSQTNFDPLENITFIAFSSFTFS